MALIRVRHVPTVHNASCFHARLGQGERLVSAPNPKRGLLREARPLATRGLSLSLADALSPHMRTGNLIVTGNLRRVLIMLRHGHLTA